MKSEGKKRARKLPFQILLGEAPQIRVRNLSDRQMEQLGEMSNTSTFFLQSSSTLPLVLPEAMGDT